jgi:hypothetical protein
MTESLKPTEPSQLLKSVQSFYVYEAKRTIKRAFRLILYVYYYRKWRKVE